jgi:hypothetical protein
MVLPVKAISGLRHNHGLREPSFYNPIIHITSDSRFQGRGKKSFPQP